MSRTDLVGLAAACVLALEAEGAALKAESDHPLFPHRPVQTCHGILGPWGKHPSAVNDRVELGFRFDGDAAQLRAVVDEAVAAYCAAYGDKTQEPDPETGRPKVDHHYDLSVAGNRADMVFHGKAGHMGAILRCDDAITKAAYVIRALEAMGARSFSVGPTPLTTLVLEGGQGFLPTHSLAEVTQRMRRAVAEAARKKGQEPLLQPGKGPCPLFSMTFDKLHNDAFARDPNSPGVRAFVECCRAVGIAVEEPLRGFDVSCDARVFAREYPGRDIITFGAGALEHAHSLQEQVRVADIVAAAKAVARFALTHEPKARDA
jgi:metal-dependent amidase/aminoacylase/carboxypeptidase family protein